MKSLKVVKKLGLKAFEILTDDLKTTFNLMSLLQVRNISIGLQLLLYVIGAGRKLLSTQFWQILMSWTPFN